MAFKFDRKLTTIFLRKPTKITVKSENAHLVQATATAMKTQ